MARELKKKRDPSRFEDDRERSRFSATAARDDIRERSRFSATAARDDIRERSRFSATAAVRRDETRHVAPVALKRDRSLDSIKRDRSPDSIKRDRSPDSIKRDRSQHRFDRTRQDRDDAIFGIHAVGEALASQEPVKRVIVGAKRKDDPAVAGIIGAAQSRSIPITFESDDAFRRFAGLNHQHVAAFAPPYGYAPWQTLRDAVKADDGAIVVALDHIEDPQNLGAILRNAEGAGVAGVVIPERRSAVITPTVRRAAAGAASHLRISAVPNLVRALVELKADGCWIFGLTSGDGARPLTGVDLRGRCVLVIGSEGKGLSRLVSSNCDVLATIPLRGKVSSLNAASAAAVALFEAVRQRTHVVSAAAEHTPRTPVNP